MHVCSIAILLMTERVRARRAPTPVLLSEDTVSGLENPTRPTPFGSSVLAVARLSGYVGNIEEPAQLAASASDITTYQLSAIRQCSGFHE